MIILPVLDLKGGFVVRAVAGKRDEYQPVISRICADATPASVARAFFGIGFRDVYVADLDAIQGAAPDWVSYEQIIGAGLSLVVDSGIKNAASAKRIADFGDRSEQLSAAVIGSESVADIGELKSAFTMLGPERAVFSLDLRHGKPIVACSAWSDKSPTEIVDSVVAAGFRRMIILDLAAVGVGEGPTTVELCRETRRRHSHLEVISGGGVRDRTDLDALCQAGCNRILVASAIHDGRLRTLRCS